MVHRFICNLYFQKTRKNIFINSSASFKHGVEINSHWGSAKEDYKSFEIRQIKRSWKNDQNFNLGSAGRKTLYEHKQSLLYNDTLTTDWLFIATDTDQDSLIGQMQKKKKLQTTALKFTSGIKI